jgi:protein-tyrosine-phosphatase
VHEGAVAAAARAGLDLGAARPRSIRDVEERPDLLVTVCDVAHEELRDLGDVRRLHWSIPDPVADGSPSAFDGALHRITSRVETLAPHVRAPHRPRRSDP